MALGELVRKLGSAACAIVGRSGSVNNESGNTAGTPIKGVTDGSPAATGYVGHVTILGGSSHTTVTANWEPTNGIIGQLGAGHWLVYGYFTWTAVAGVTQVGAYISTNSVPGTHIGHHVETLLNVPASLYGIAPVVCGYLSVSGSQDLYGQVKSIGNNGVAIGVYGYAIRLR